MKRLIAMLDGSNIPGFDTSKPQGSLWGKARVGVAGTVEATPIFPGSQVDFGMRIGMQEQGAATLSDLAFGDGAMQVCQPHTSSSLALSLPLSPLAHRKYLPHGRMR